jgi:hypothetical protein
MFFPDPMTVLVSTYVLPSALATCSLWSLYLGASAALGRHRGIGPPGRTSVLAGNAGRTRKRQAVGPSAGPLHRRGGHPQA